MKINEVMVTNTKTIADESGAFPPWLELYNPTDAAVDLSGVPLSDDLGEVDKWLISGGPEAVMPPHGFLVIFCDGSPAGTKGLHASFRLEPGSLELVLNEGANIFRFDATLLEPDQSAGRFPDGSSGPAVLGSPTPGAANVAPQPPEATFIRGDANGDGRVNITDMTEIFGVLFRSKPAPSCLDRLDSDDNGKVNLADALLIGDSLYRHGPPLPPPFPAPGLDPTPDGLPCLGE